MISASAPGINDKNKDIQHKNDPPGQITDIRKADHIITGVHPFSKVANVHHLCINYTLKTAAPHITDKFTKKTAVSAQNHSSCKNNQFPEKNNLFNI